MLKELHEAGESLIVEHISTVQSQFGLVYHIFRSYECPIYKGIR
jgi:hypothetical protein